MPNLRTLELFAEELPPRSVTLSGMSATLALTCLDAANRIYDWNYDGEPLTDEQIDQVQLILGVARKELMVSRIGEVIMSASDETPSGCLFCDGTVYDASDYPELYSLLAPEFIVDATQFRVPDLRQSFPMGVDAPLDVGETGGTATVTLSESEIPSHSHSIGGAGTTIAAPGAVPVLTPSIFPGSTGSTGGGGSHTNIPPFVGLAFYIVAQ